MFDNFVFILAFRYFKSKNSEKFISVVSGVSLIGIIIGVAALIIVMSVMNGFHRDFTNSIIGLQGEIKVYPLQKKTIDDYKNILNMLNKYFFIKKMFLLIKGQGLVIGNTVNIGAIVKGIDIEDLQYKQEIVENIIEGSLKDYRGTDVIAIGNELAKSLNVQVGSTIRIITANFLLTIVGNIPRSKEYRVVAIFNSGFYNYDSNVIHMPKKAAEKLFLLTEDSVNLIEIITDNKDNTKKYSKIIQEEMGFKSSLRVVSWDLENKALLYALEVERIVMFMILLLIIVIAAFNILSSLFMIVKNKTKDIAILKTIGATTKQIMIIFIIHGMLIGIIGTILGIIIGLTISYNIDSIRRGLETISNSKIFDSAIYFLYHLPSEIKLADIVLVTIISLFLCFIATIYPSFKAAKLDPVDAIKYE